MDKSEGKKKKRITDEQREQMLILQNSGKTVMEIAKELDLKRTTVHEVLKRTNKMLNTNVLKLRRMKKKKRKQKAELLTDEQVDLINLWLDEDCQTSIQKIVDRLLVQCDVTISKSYVAKVIDDFHYSINRIDFNAEVHNDEVTMDLRRDFAQRFINLPITFNEEQIIFVHMARFNISLRILSDKKNERSAKRIRYNAISCAINKDQVIAYQSKHMALDPEDVVNFFAAIVDTVKNGLLMDSAVLIMDEKELGPERDVIIEFLEANNLSYMFVPQYSLFLNPIEKIYSTWKEFTRKANPTDEPSLIQAIDTGRSLITAKDCENCYLTALSFLLRCLHNKPIEELSPQTKEMKAFVCVIKEETIKAALEN